MDRAKALQIVLVGWAVAYESSLIRKEPDTDCLPNLIKSTTPTPPKFDTALVVWFGTYNPDPGTLENFMSVYQGWMTAIWYKMTELMLGEILISQVIVNQATEETSM